jgi:ATP-dependent DNA helicase RecG
MHTIKNNLKSKLFFIRKNLSIYYKKPESYLKTLKEDIEFLSPTLYREIENINYSNLSISYLDNLLTKIINLSVDHENENVSNLNAIKLTNIGGVGDKTLKQLSTIDIISVYDLLTHFPLRYEILQEVYKDKEGVLSGVLLNIEKIKTRNNKKILQAHFEGKSEYFTCVWLHYNNNYPVKLLKSGNVYHMFGNITYFNGKKSIFHPEFLQRQDLGTIRPVYTLPKIVKKKIYRNLVIGAFKTYFDNIEETLSSDILRRYNYPGIKESLRIIHFPEDKNTLSCILARKHPAVQRFIYEELFYLQLGLLIKKQYYESVKGISFNVTLDDLRGIKKFVPFTLTTAQKKVLAEIINDMRSQKQMNRLIQGDVGSGKTILAMI